MKRSPQMRLAAVGAVVLASAISHFAFQSPPPSNGRDITSAFDARYRPILSLLPTNGALSYWSDDPDLQRDYLVQFAIAPVVLAVNDTRGEVLLLDVRGARPGITPPPDVARRATPISFGQGLYLAGKHK